MITHSIRVFRETWLLAIAAMLFGTSVFAEIELLDKVAAIVNDDVVTVSEVETRYQNFLMQTSEAGVTDLPPKNVILEQILERLILESVQIQEAALRGIVVDDEELTEAVRSYADQNGMQIDEFRNMLEQQGVSYLGFRDDLHRQILLQKVQQTLVNRRIYISEHDVQDFRNSPFFELLASDQYRVGHILIATPNSSDSRVLEDAENRALDIVDQLREGADFATMAVNHSSASSALEGGDLGWRHAEELPSLFAEVVLKLEVGETTVPLRNPLGFHIVQLVDKRGASTSKAEQSLVRHILVRPTTIKSEEEAREEIISIREQILAGADFAEFAIEKSDDPGTALDGGELGWTDGRNFDPTFVEVMNSIEVGQISQAFRTEFGWHILEVMERRIEDLSEEALDDLALRALHQRQFEDARQEWLKEIRDEAFVKIIEDSG